MTYPTNFNLQSTTKHALYFESKHDHFDEGLVNLYLHGSVDVIVIKI